MARIFMSSNVLELDSEVFRKKIREFPGIPLRSMEREGMPNYQRFGMSSIVAIDRLCPPLTGGVTLPWNFTRRMASLARANHFSTCRDSRKTDELSQQVCRKSAGFRRRSRIDTDGALTDTRSDAGVAAIWAVVNDGLSRAFAMQNRPPWRHHFGRT
jgi:hypothetical protein